MLEAYGVPSNIRVPFLYFGVDNSLAGFFQSSTRALIVGQMDEAFGTATASQAIQVFNNEDYLFGVGSMITQMIRAYRKNNGTAEIWALPVADAGTKSVWTVTISGASPDQAEIVSLLVAGETYQVNALPTDDSAAIASKLVSSINDNPRAPVLATLVGSVVTLTAKHAGEAAGSIDVRAEYRRRNITLPATIGVAVAQTVVGAGNPDCSAAVANLAEEPFEWVAFPYLDSNNLTAISNEYNDTSGRWSGMRQLYGHIFSTMDATTANRIALGQSLNSQHLSIPTLYKSPTPAYLIAAAVAGKAQLHLSDAPELSRPLQTIKLECVMPPEIADVDDKTTRQVLYYNGLGGFAVSRDGSVMIDRLLTTYHTNAWGADDNSYLDVQILAQLMYMIRYINAKKTQVFPRHSLKNDGEYLPPGSYTATPAIVKPYLAAWGEELGRLNVIEDVERFISLISIGRNPNDPNALDMIIRPDLVNQYRIGKILVQFFNQYPQNAIPGVEVATGV